MKTLTNKQLKEIVCLDYFCQDIKNYADTKLNSNLNFSADIILDKNGLSPEWCYFLITDQGKKQVFTTVPDRLRQLLDAKKWRLRMIDMWEESFSGGYDTYIGILYEDYPKNKVPIEVMEFVAKTMFDGADEDLIKWLWEHPSENRLTSDIKPSIFSTTKKKINKLKKSLNTLEFL